MVGADYDAETAKPSGYQYKLGAGDGKGGDHKTYMQTVDCPNPAMSCLKPGAVGDGSWTNENSGHMDGATYDVETATPSGY